ncbi:MAG TPA: GntR family transcriptional regulator [Candidatus Faecivivens stercorigallinarum]|nr:GntR family transcriptional regulator [Candidatus Faecivivens stercorigallinarum]
MFQIDLRGGKGAIYQQLKDEVIRLCSMGILSADDQLPSVRALARELGINPNTVAKAYSQLESDGITYSVAGRGSFIRGDVFQMEDVRKKMLGEFIEAAQKAKSLGFQKSELTEQLNVIYDDSEEAG